MARVKPPLSNEALMLEVLQELPAPGGKSIVFKDLKGLLGRAHDAAVVNWSAIPQSCDPVFILDNPANNVRRKGNLEQQLSQMILGRPGESQQQDFAATASATNSRGAVKRWQVESFVAVLRHLLADSDRRHHVVDFGCGTGTLLLPLAVLFPHCTFTGVEMKPAAVALLLERARAAGLTNVVARRCMIEEFLEQPFDVALALHACGNATDAALLLAARRRAAYVVSPCCVGKLKFSLAGGSSFSASVHSYTPTLPGERRASRAAAPAALAATAAPTSGAPEPAASGLATGAGGGASGLAADAQAARAQAGPVEEGGGVGALRGSGAEATSLVALGEIRHPRSQWMREQLPDPETQFRVMAKVADQNHSGATSAFGGGGAKTVAAVAAYLCKAHVELDRNLAAVEDCYTVGMFKCFHWKEMAKSDMLVGVPAEREWVGFADEIARCPNFEAYN